MNQHITRAWLTTRSSIERALHRLAHEAGEGVISAAITVLIMAFLGAAMWVAFDQLFTDTSGTVADQVGQIGGGSTGGGGGGTTTSP
ncbi:MAG TPA: hypothetical protein VGA69_04175 [Nitriliruptorales bacterium]